MRILDLGCGKRKHPGAVGVDVSLNSDADVICDLDHFPYPFRDNTFDLVICYHVLEHLNDLVRAMAELHRITKPGGVVRISVPYYAHCNAFGDPTHRRFFTYRTFEFFADNVGSGVRTYYTDFKFHIVHRELTTEYRLYKWMGIHTVMRRCPLLYERYLATLFPAMSLNVELRVPA